MNPDFIWNGGHDENSRKTELRAGSLSMIYETGNLRHIKIGQTEILRMIYSALRDKDWLTILPSISEEKTDIKPDSFNIVYSAKYVSGNIAFSARYTIEGGNNRLIFSFEGEALSTFEKKRIGFCVLHPVKHLAGTPCETRHPDNTSSPGMFPVNISPQQPFLNIAGMNWEIDGIKCSLDFEGDIFEAEDQRNWTDASYKTYCTPLSLKPVRMKKGDRISQRVILRIESDIQEEPETEVLVIRLLQKNTFYIPAIGIGRSTRPEALTAQEIDVLKTIPFEHYRTDLYLFDADWPKNAGLALNESQKLGYPLELALFFDEDHRNQISKFVNWITVNDPKVKNIIIYNKNASSPVDQLSDLVAPEIRKVLPGASISCGTNANFAQLNRNRPTTQNCDMLCYSVHPQEHASDNLTLIENLEGQAYTVESAKIFAKGKDILISPVNIQRRFNANNQSYETPLYGNVLPSQVDPRIMTVFGACWAAGSLKYLSESGAAAITFFETAGERGIIQGDFSSRWPGEFPSEKGMIFPVFHVFRYILQDKGFRIFKSQSSDPLKVEVLALTNGRYNKLLVSNFTPEYQDVKIPGMSSMPGIKTLDQKTYLQAANDHLWLNQTGLQRTNIGENITLSPFSLNFIEF
jgi:D-apionolactonase